MSHFMDKLHVDLQDDSVDPPLWVLRGRLRYICDKRKRAFTVPAGFVTDFASVPRFPLAFMMTANTAHRAAVLHDYLYKSRVVSRSDADSLFREACAATDVPAWRRWIMWAGIRVFGAPHYGASSDLDEHQSFQ